MAAEKIDAMIRLEMINSRMKDFYDIWLMSKIFEFDGTILQNSIKSTLKRRNTRLPEGLPLVFTAEFSTNTQTTLRTILELFRKCFEGDPGVVDGVKSNYTKEMIPNLVTSILKFDDESAIILSAVARRCISLFRHIARWSASSFLSERSGKMVIMLIAV